MIALTAEEIAAITSGTLNAAAAKNSSLPVTAPAVIDSRHVVPGCLFVAMTGDNVDGHDYAEAAVAGGAALVLAEHDIAGHSVPVPAVIVPDVNAAIAGTPRWIPDVPNAAWALGAVAREALRRLREHGRPTVVAVTGSAGKTTTKDLMAAIFSADGPTVAPVGSFNNQIGLPLTVTQADGNTRWLVLEMGANHMGEIADLCRVAPPDIGIELMVGTAHLGEFGSQDNIAAAKRELVEGLSPTGSAILNADDPRVAAMSGAARAHGSGAILTFGIDMPADVRGSAIHEDDAGHVILTVHAGAWNGKIHTGLVGRHNAYNVLAALAAARAAGIDIARAADIIEGRGPASPHRMAITDAPRGWRIVDDSYNANPQSIREALRTLVAMSDREGRPAVAILGEMFELGDKSPGEHQKIVELVTQTPVAGTILVGQTFTDVTRAVSAFPGADGIVCVPEASDVLPTLEKLVASFDRNDPIVLVKGSHGTGLWRVADALAEGGPVPC